jgi:glycosyltransferase involved in cell wall biosynthesis
MVAAILKLYDSPDFAKNLAFHAREKVEQFDWEIVKRKWIDILK